MIDAAFAEAAAVRARESWRAGGGVAACARRRRAAAVFVVCAAWTRARGVGAAVIRKGRAWRAERCTARTTWSEVMVLGWRGKEAKAGWVKRRAMEDERGRWKVRRWCMSRGSVWRVSEGISLTGGLRSAWVGVCGAKERDVGTA